MLYHCYRFFYTPDPEPTGPAAAPPNTEAPDISLPRDIDDLVALADRVADHWLTAPEITMIGMTSAGFRSLVTDMQKRLATRKSIGGQRPAQTIALQNLNAEADAAVKKVKTYLIGKYENEDIAQAQYARFGIVNESGNYRLPHDMQDRQGALGLMIAAIAEDGLGTKEYGTDFWTNFQKRYNAALSKASDTDSGVSEALAALNGQEEQVRDVLTGLRYILRGNYLKTYQQVWRAWGFQAEDY